MVSASVLESNPEGQPLNPTCRHQTLVQFAGFLWSTNQWASFANIGEDEILRKNASDDFQRKTLSILNTSEFTTNLVCIVCHFWNTTENCFCCFNTKIYQDSKLKPQLLGNSDPSETCPSQQLLWTKKLDGCLAKGHYRETKIQLIQMVFCKHWYFLEGASQKQKLLRAIYEKSSFLKEIVQHLLGVQEKKHLDKIL